MSDSGDSAKAEKKREYNRNAQRLFRQRRKEHLKTLERSEKERSSSHAEEIEHLRQEINRLRAENRTLRSDTDEKPSSLNVSVPSSAAMSSSPSPYPRGRTSTVYPLEFYDSINDSATDEVVLSPSDAHEKASYEYKRGHRHGTDPEMFVTLFPQDIATVRRDLYMRLGRILDVNILSNPSLHLSTLAALGPSLPPPLQPTLLQLQTPHHAYIDLIPSPTLRESLIKAGVVVANNFLTEVCAFVYEAEDLGQLIIWGHDYLNVMAWEFSEEALKAWPNILTLKWRERANFWRAQRNEPLIIFD